MTTQAIIYNKPFSDTTSMTSCCKYVVGEAALHCHGEGHLLCHSNYCVIYPVVVILCAATDVFSICVSAWTCFLIFLLE